MPTKTAVLFTFEVEGPVPPLFVTEQRFVSPRKNHTCCFCNKEGKFPYTRLFFSLDDPRVNGDRLKPVLEVIACDSCQEEAVVRWNEVLEKLPEHFVHGELVATIKPLFDAAGIKALTFRVVS